MSWTVWRICHEGNVAIEEIVISDLPTRRLAERLVANLEDIYGDESLWVEED